MKKISLLVGLLVVAAMMSGCAMFDGSTDRSGDGYSSHSGHSHH